MIRAAVSPATLRLRLPRLGWGPGAVSAAQASALALPLLVAIAARGPGVFLAAALAAGIAELVFSLLRGRGMAWHGLPTAMAVAVMVPAGLPLWQVALAVVFGMVLADLVFGGRGFGFLSAAVAALAFLVFSFPGVSLTGGGAWVAVASVPGAALLVSTGLVSWRVIAAAAVAALATVAVGQVDLLAAATALTFGVVFLTADPVGAVTTNPARWAYGALVGWLAVTFASGEAAALPTSLVFATLVGSIFAPLFDHVAVVWIGRRLRG